MKLPVRSLASWATLGIAAALAGCVGYPVDTAYDTPGYAYGGYGGYGGYGESYYANPTVVAPSVYISGGNYDRPVNRGYRGGRYDGRPGYGPRPYPGARPGPDVRPRPGVGRPGGSPQRRLPSRPLPQPPQPDKGIP